MAFTRARNGRHIGLYVDSEGRQKSAGTFDTPKLALQQAIMCEQAERNGQDGAKLRRSRQPKEQEAHSRTGKMTVAAYTDAWLPRKRLEETAREGYGYSLAHVKAM